MMAPSMRSARPALSAWRRIPGPPRDLVRARLLRLYRGLLRRFGPQGWWPGRSPFETAAGASLPQHPAWVRAARARPPRGPRAPRPRASPAAGADRGLRDRARVRAGAPAVRSGALQRAARAPRRRGQDVLPRDPALRRLPAPPRFGRPPAPALRLARGWCGGWRAERAPARPVLRVLRRARLRIGAR